MEDGLPNKERILRQQGKDSFCSAEKPKTQSSKSKYFLDDDGVMYRCRSDHKHQLVVPKPPVRDIFIANRNPVYVAHPRKKRTYDLIFLSYWWPGMQKLIEDYVRKCDPYQRRKENREFVAPLGEVEEPTTPFEVTSKDTTGPYLVTPCRNKYLLMFTSPNMWRPSPFQTNPQEHVPEWMQPRLSCDAAQGLR